MKAIAIIASMMISAACFPQTASISLEYESPSQEGETTCKEFYIESINSVLELQDCDEEFDRITVEGTSKILVCAKRGKDDFICEKLADGSLDREEIDIFRYDAVLIYFEGYKVASIKISKPRCK
jgi:hypothetical protein